MRKHAISLAQGSMAFKWAWNTELRDYKIAACSAFGARMYTHVSFIQESRQTAGPRGIFHWKNDLEWLPGHMPVCCRMSNTELWHFARLHVHTTCRERFSEHFHSSNVAPKVIPLGEQRIYQWDVKISSKSLARLCVMNVSCRGTIVGKRKFTLILSWNFLNCFCIVLRCNWRPR